MDFPFRPISMYEIMWPLHYQKLGLSHHMHEQYVGETKREFKFRMAKHIRDTCVKRETPVSLHFNEPDHSFENMIF